MARPDRRSEAVEALQDRLGWRFSDRALIEEALEAGLLAQVVDASDPNFERQLAVTNEVLAEIGAADVPRLLVFNKIDRAGDGMAEVRASADLLRRWPDAVVMSARQPEDVADLRARLIAFFARDLVEGEVHVAYDRQQLRGEIYDGCQVLGERYDDRGVIFQVRTHPTVLKRLQAGSAMPSA